MVINVNSGSSGRALVIVVMVVIISQKYCYPFKGLLGMINNTSTIGLFYLMYKGLILLQKWLILYLKYNQIFDDIRLLI